jgi:hypothetical protein
MGNDTLRYYKIATYTLLGILLLIFGYIGLNYLSAEGYQQGFQQGKVGTVNSMMEQVEENNYVTLYINNRTMTLVPIELYQNAQQRTLENIINSVRQEGQVSLGNQNEEITLVPSNRKLQNGSS